MATMVPANVIVIIMCLLDGMKDLLILELGNCFHNTLKPIFKHLEYKYPRRADAIPTMRVMDTGVVAVMASSSDDDDDADEERSTKALSPE